MSLPPQLPPLQLWSPQPLLSLSSPQQSPQPLPRRIGFINASYTHSPQRCQSHSATTQARVLLNAFCMTGPCKLDRQDCLLNNKFAARLMLQRTPTSTRLEPLLEGPSLAVTPLQSCIAGSTTAPMIDHDDPLSALLSHFEQVITSRLPVFEVLLLHLPTSAILDLYHTSGCLRSFLRAYPLAWKNLSFRLLPAQAHIQATVSGFDSPNVAEPKRPYALDHFLRSALPTTNCLTRLDLDNTSVSGTQLHTSILDPGRSTLKHLSVRGCKDVSIKYHILPFLHMQMSHPPDLFNHKPFVMESLYTYRCRHHRRRPYLPSSLSRRDSDSQPTHQLIEMCHHLGIYTDTAWCPTPGGRCYRRKDYFLGRSGAGAPEVWVPYDRLWRSQNIVGSAGLTDDSRRVRDTYDRGIGRLWEDGECGYGGEALGSTGYSFGEGKEVPVHLRSSHRTFVEDFTCHACGDKILERCEQCSVRMHCMGCRKTLCHSCAFDRPVRKKRRRNNDSQIQATLAMILGPQAGSTTYGRHRSKRQEQPRRRDPFWWAPGAIRSPNYMKEESPDADESSSDDDNDILTIQQALHSLSLSTAPLRLDMQWCCLKPSFSGGGGIGFLGTPCGDNVRAAPLPQGRGFEDPAFRTIDAKPPPSDTSSQCDSFDESFTSDDSTRPDAPSCSTIPVSDVDNFSILPYLEQPQDPSDISFKRYTAPRNLCTGCYNSTTWKIPCAGCQFPICIEHDLKRLKARRCGFRRLCRERAVVQQCKDYVRRGVTVPRAIAEANIMFFLAKWQPIIAQMAIVDTERKQQGKWTPDDFRPKILDLFQLGHTQPRVERAPPLTREELVLPDLRVLLDRTRQSNTATVEKDTDAESPSAKDIASATRRTIRPPRKNLSRAKSTSSIPYTREVFRTKTFPTTQRLLPHNQAALPRASQLPLNNPTISMPALPTSTTAGTSHTSPTPIPTSTAPLPPLGHPPTLRTALFLGCGSYLCPSPRRPGDTRPPCSAQQTALYCVGCGILVCGTCRVANPPCSCASCSAVFRCPNCAGDDKVRRACRWKAEEEARRAVGLLEEFWREVERR